MTDLAKAKLVTGLILEELTRVENWLYDQNILTKVPLQRCQKVREHVNDLYQIATTEYDNASVKNEPRSDRWKGKNHVPGQPGQ